VLRGNRIFEGKQGGISIFGKASAECEDNTVHSNTTSNVTVSDEGTKAVLKGNVVRDGKEAGVIIRSNGSALLENNDIHSNTRANVAVTDGGSEAVVMGNRIHDGKNCGVVVSNTGKATLTDNTIEGNDLAGVCVSDKSHVSLEGNTIRGNGRCTIERTAEELAAWSEAGVIVHRSADGFPGVQVEDSTVVYLPKANIIEENGKVSTVSISQKDRDV
jgi:parallel beta-helix repeat protein